jgi:hypothetical protein
LKISEELRTFVLQRANLRREYCLIHQDDAAFSHEVDHVISKQHGGETVESNLGICMYGLLAIQGCKHGFCWVVPLLRDLLDSLALVERQVLRP